MKKALICLLSVSFILSTSNVFAATEKYNSSKKPVVVSKPAPKVGQMMASPKLLDTLGINDGPIAVEWVNPLSNGDVIGKFDFKIKATGGGGADSASFEIYTGGNPIKINPVNLSIHLKITNLKYRISVSLWND